MPANSALTILVVEDEWLLRQAMTEALRDAGWRVLETARGEDAVSVLACEHVDVLVTDIELAGALTGWEVAQAARRCNSGLPVIYASGTPGQDPRRVSPSLFIRKPCSLRALLEACRRLSRGHGHARALEARA